MLKRVSAIILCIILMSPVVCLGEEENDTDNLGITAKSAILAEVSTGKVVYEINSDEILSPASITKIMTLILVFEKLDEGKIKLDDFVTTSEYAKSMGGSQVFLETGEKQTVETLIKCIVIASGNDACVAMAEFIAGSEPEFVKMMNKKASELGMKNTHFVDCCGLTDSDEHYTTAKDVAIMSCELLHKHPQIKKYSTIWMENITHVTKKGNTEFGLSNTNKLLKMNCNYEITGLKTGSTNKAKYCVSASAYKDGLELVAVIMAAPDYKVRFSQAQTLLNYGYANCVLYSDDEKIDDKINIDGGVSSSVPIERKNSFSYIANNGKTPQIDKNIELKDDLAAPIHKGDNVGSIKYYIGEEEIGNVEIVALGNVKKAKYGDFFWKSLKRFLL